MGLDAQAGEFETAGRRNNRDANRSLLLKGRFDFGVGGTGVLPTDLGVFGISEGFTFLFDLGAILKSI